MNRTLFKTLIFALIVAGGVYAPKISSAAPICENVFTSAPEKNAAGTTLNRLAEQPPPKGVFDKLKSFEDFKEREPQIRKMINFLLLANKKIPAVESILSEISSQPFSLDVVDLMPKTNYALIRIQTPQGSVLDLRTNGSFVFLSSTYRYRTTFQTRNHFAVGMVGKRLSTFRQTDLILSTLPDKIILSRNMEEAERKMWLNGGRFVGNFGPKVHFSPNHFFYMKTEPYRVELSKEHLLEFHQRNELEINIYDPVNRDSMLMQTTEVGIEFEYVFVGDNAIKNLSPLMKEQLQ